MGALWVVAGEARSARAGTKGSPCRHMTGIGRRPLPAAAVHILPEPLPAAPRLARAAGCGRRSATSCRGL